MKFRTEIEPRPVEPRIDHSRRGFSVGSCFAASIADKLRRYKFPIACNPTGVLYNPFSIADLLEGLAAPDQPTDAAEQLRNADYALVTFGTAWVYEEGGRVVANCGKRPAHLFTRRRLGVDEIVGRFRDVMGGALAGKQVVFTLSPIRHLKDGAEENSLSKATLRLAIAQIVEEHGGQAHYFPAYELLMDDLRDYRFYARDLAHPSPEAVDYIWERFVAAALTPEAQRLLPEIERIVRAAEHRPFGPDTAEHAAFRRATLEKARALAATRPDIDLDTEIEFFS